MDNTITLKIIIGDAVSEAKLELTKENVAELSKHFNAAQGSVNKFSNLSKRDLGQFANQVLYSTDVTGRLGSQLSGLASGLVTGGAIGAAFAGFSAIINLASEKSKEFDETIRKLKDDTIELADKISIYRQQMEELTNPDIWTRFQIIWMNLQGQGEVIDQIIKNRIDTLNKLYNTIGTGEQGLLGRLQEQIQINTELRDSATTTAEISKHQSVINKLQEQYDNLLGKNNKKLEEQKKHLGDIAGLAELLVKNRVGEAGVFGDASGATYGITSGNADDRENLQLMATEALNVSIKNQIDLVSALTRGYNAAGDAVASSIGQSIRLFDNANSLAEIFLETLFKIAAEQAVLSIFSFITGGISGGGLGILGQLFGGARAEGGDVEAGKIYRVNEKGMEFFRPNSGGTIIPINEMYRAMMLRQQLSPQAVNIKLQGELGIDLYKLSFRLKKVEEVLETLT